MARLQSVRSLVAFLPFTIGFVGAALVITGHAQAPQSAPPAQPTQTQRAATGDSSEVRAIIVDVVVRDKDGNPVIDLTPADFELSEDGAKQDLSLIHI